MKVIKRILIILIIVLFLLSSAFFGMLFFVQKKYEVNLLKSIGSINELSKDFSEDQIVKSPISKADLESAISILNTSINGLVSLSANGNYVINFDLSKEEMLCPIKINPKEVCALLNLLLEQKFANTISARINLPIIFKQIGFSNPSFNFGFGCHTKLHIIAKVDLAKALKEKDFPFPLNFLKNKLPEEIYISSSLKLTKDQTNFSYVIMHESFSVNGFSEKEFCEIYSNLDWLLSFGEISSFNKALGESIMDLLVGNEQNSGFAYSLIDLGATNYEFIYENSVDYFLIT